MKVCVLHVPAGSILLELSQGALLVMVQIHCRSINCNQEEDTGRRRHLCFVIFKVKR